MKGELENIAEGILRLAADVKVIEEEGLAENTWQQDWDDKKGCLFCGAESYLVMTVMEKEGSHFICDYKPESVELGEPAEQEKPLPEWLKEGYTRDTQVWPHDAIAVAIYFCPHCHEAYADWNQG